MAKAESSALVFFDIMTKFIIVGKEMMKTNRFISLPDTAGTCRFTGKMTPVLRRMRRMSRMPNRCRRRDSIAADGIGPVPGPFFMTGSIHASPLSE